MDSSIKFNVSANTAQFQSGMKQVDSVAKSTSAGIKQAFAGVGSMLAGGAALAGLKSLMNDFDRVGKLATRFGTSAESIQRVSVAADVAGTNIEQVANAMTKAGVAASQAVEKGGTMAETFARAGIDAQKFANAQLDQKLLMVAEAFAAAGDDANKTNAIIEILGTRAGANLIPLVSNVEALKAEMEGVAVASDAAVRQIEKANDTLTRFGNSVSVLGARLIEDFGLGVQQLTSFFSGTGLKTIDQLKEVEARAKAIKQLTAEGVFGMDAERNAALIAERTKQILDQTRGTNQQIQIAEDMTEQVVDLEKDKTAELERQAELLERQEQKRQDAIRSMEAEIALIEAKLSGNKELEASLREQADFQEAMAKTGDTELAANFAAVKAAERAAMDAGGAASGSSGGSAGLSLGPTGARVLTENERVAELRGAAKQQRADQRAAELAGAGKFRSAIRAQDRGQRAFDREMQNARIKDMASQFDFAGREAQNAGEAMKSLQDSMGRMNFAEQLRNTAGYDPTKSDLENFKNNMKEFVSEQSKTPEERVAEEEAARQKHDSRGGGGNPLQGVVEGIRKLLEQVNEKLPQHAIV